MGEDEIFVMLFGCMAALVFWAIWYMHTSCIGELFRSSTQKMLLAFTPLVCGIALFAVLKLWASHDVRDAAQYLFMYQAMGAGWVGAFAICLFPWLGVHYAHDALERANTGAAIAVCGGLLGFTLAFAGGNIGDGPGWWVVVFASGLATFTLAGCWALLAQYANMAEEITVDRDLAAGVRLGGFLLAGGMICGRAAAGNWISAAATLVDFWRVGWFMAPLLLLTWAFDYLGSPTPERPKPSVLAYGIVPSLLGLGLAVVAHMTRGGW